ncbi:MAG: DUF4258 domain-containing protein [Candidatus Riflebacteria bacterium]|nr:DUF4258 domain-containing protein [Candidatus Riflebacteria bacterium]
MPPLLEQRRPVGANLLYHSAVSKSDAVPKRQQEILVKVREAALKKILYLPHAARQMARPDRMISPQEVREAVSSGLVIEDYPEDARGHSCLMLGRGDGGKVIHIVCSPKPDYLAIITAYRPDDQQWSPDYRRRR